MARKKYKVVLVDPSTKKELRALRIGPLNLQQAIQACATYRKSTPPEVRTAMRKPF